ncbi:MAG: 3-phosphoshikimate 1-carboxyvinyltransferase [Anaerolineales bacterium]
MLTITPGSPLRGSVTVPGDKSISHRAALFAALAEGVSHIENFLMAGVTKVMLDALTALGISWELEGTSLIVHGKGISNLQSPISNLHCGNSATTLRLLAGAIAAANIDAVLDGSPGLRRRPMDRIVEPLREMGVDVEATDGKYAPLTFHKSAIRNHPIAQFPNSPIPDHRSPITHHPSPITFSLPVASAQVKTCLLLAALTADRPLTILEPGPSRDHTERMLASMGVEVSSEQLAVVSNQYSAGSAMGDQSPISNLQYPIPELRYQTTLTPPHPRTLSPLHMTIPGDISSAAFLIVAALITPGSEITIRGVGLNPTRTGLLDALTAMGAQLPITNYQLQNGEPVGDLTVSYSPLHGTEISGPLVVRMIDEFPAFAVAAAYASGPTIVREAAELRHKESDRISVLCEQLRAVGVEIEEAPDGFTLPGNTIPRGGIINPHGDHRLAMSLAVAGLGAQGPIAIQNPNIIHESYPEFQPTLERLGAQMD